MGFVILIAMFLYLLISLGVVAWAISHAKKNGMSMKRWGWGAALVMYLIPFWDLIPTVATHQFYCAKDSGFWVYKTIDQWKTENPGVMETLVEINNSPEGMSPNWPSDNWRGKKIARINQRFGMMYIDHLSSSDEGELFPNVWRWKYEFLDKKTGEVLARQIDFSSGNDGYIGGMHSMKFWLTNEHCMGSKELSNDFGEFLKQFRGRNESKNR